MAPPSAAAPAPAADTPAPAAAAGPARTILLRGDRLTVQVTDVALDDVLREVIAPSKAELKGAVKAPRNVTADFADVPVQDGLTRLLGDQNFLITFRDDGSLRSVTLLGGPLERPPETRVVKTAEAAPMTQAEMLQHPVQVGGRLQEFLGQPSATLQQLIDITLHQEDAALRLEAMRAGMGAIDSQPQLQQRFIQSVEGADEQTLVNVLRGAAQGRAREIASQLASVTRTPAIRTRWLRLIRLLNEAESGDVVTR